MCYLEIWTYRECGCSYDHYVPCCDVPQDQKHDTARAHHLSSSSTTSVRSWSSNQPESIHLQGHNSAGIKHSTDGSCGNLGQPNVHSCNHLAAKTIHKEFLEPICDDCVLEELENSFLHDPASTYITSAQSPSQERVILDSNIIIEIEKYSTDDRTCFDETEMTSVNNILLNHNFASGYDNIEPEDLTPTRDSSPSVIRTRIPSRKPVRASVDTFTTNNDADDEGSLNLRPSLASTFTSPCDSPPRGRARNRTQDLRREGIELSREGVRISSRWSSSETRSMERFRNAIREIGLDKVKGDNILTRWVAKERTSPWSMARDVKTKVKGLSSSLSRSRSTRNIHTNPHVFDEASSKELNHNHLQNQAVSDDDGLLNGPALPTLKLVKNEDDDTLLESNDNASGGMRSSESITASRFAVGQGIDESMNTVPFELSWHEHLEQDLTSRTRDKRRVRLARSMGNLLDRPFRHRFQATSKSKAPKSNMQITGSQSSSPLRDTEVQRSTTNSAIDRRHSERSTSIYSSHSSLVAPPATSLSCAMSAAWPLLPQAGERLGEVIKPDDFEHNSEDGLFSSWQQVNSTTSSRRHSGSSLEARHATEPRVNSETLRSRSSMQSLVDAIQNLQLQQELESSDTAPTGEEPDLTLHGESQTPDQGDRRNDLINAFPEPPQHNRLTFDKRVSSLSWSGSTSAMLQQQHNPYNNQESHDCESSRLSIHPLTTGFVQGLSFSKKRQSDLHEQV